MPSGTGTLTATPAPQTHRPRPCRRNCSTPSWKPASLRSPRTSSTRSTKRDGRPCPSARRTGRWTWPATAAGRCWPGVPSSGRSSPRTPRSGRPSSPFCWTRPGPRPSRTPASAPPAPTRSEELPADPAPALSEELLRACLPALCLPELAELPRPQVTARRTLHHIAHHVHNNPPPCDPGRRPVARDRRRPRDPRPAAQPAREAGRRLRLRRPRPAPR